MTAKFLITILTFIACTNPLSAYESDRQDFFEDWSFLNESQKFGQRGGIFVQVTQKGLTYIGQLIHEALITAADAPSSDNDTLSESNPEPRVVLRLIKNTGIGLKLFLPKWILNATAILDIDEDAMVQMLVKIGKDDRGYPLITVPFCESRTGLLERGMDSFIARLLPEKDVCQSFLNLTRCWNLRDRVDSGCWRWNPEAFCPEGHHGWGVRNADVRKGQHHHKLVQNLGDFSIDYLLMDDPIIRTDHILFPLRGEFLYQNATANVTSTPLIIDRYPVPANKMFQKIITEHSWNTLFAHIYHQKLITFEEKFSMSILPMVVRFPLESVCWSCWLHVELTLSQPPTTRIDTNGIKIRAKFQLELAASGFLYKAHVMDGQAELNASLVLSVIEGVLSANVAIENVQVDPGTTGLASYMPVTFKTSFEKWIEHRVWPSLSDAVLAAMDGSTLDGLCGFNVTNMDLVYMPGATIISGDVKYDMRDTVRKILEDA